MTLFPRAIVIMAAAFKHGLNIALKARALGLLAAQREVY